MSIFDFAERMARAKALGYNVDEPLYHASKQDIHHFTPGYEDGLIFTTPNPEFANDWIGKGKYQWRKGTREALEEEEHKLREQFFYGDGVLRKLEEKHGNEAWKNPEWRAEYDKRRAAWNNRNDVPANRVHAAVYPLYTRANKTFNPEQHPEIVEEWIKRNGWTDPEVVKGARNGNYLLWETKGSVDFLKEKGFDSMMIRESTQPDAPFTTKAIFDPKDIRSVHAQFDPAKKDSSNILASIAAIAGGGVLGASLPNESKADPVQQAVDAVFNMGPADRTVAAIESDRKRRGYDMPQGEARAQSWVDEISQPLMHDAYPLGQRMPLRSGEFIPGPQGRVTEQDWSELQWLSEQPGYEDLPLTDRALLRGAQGLSLTGILPVVGGITKKTIADPVRNAAKKTVKEKMIEQLKSIPISVRGLDPVEGAGDMAIKRIQHDAFGDNLTEQGKEYVKWVKKATGKGQSAVHANQKTGFSIDFSTSCPKRGCKGGACAYCYVEQPRSEKKFGTGPGMFAKRDNLDNPYRGELQAMPPDVVNELNRDGGMRMFSFSDYRPKEDFENVTNVLRDAQAKGLYIKATTKERRFVEQFGDHPNLRINVSVDALPRKISNAPTVEQALKWKGGRDNVKIRAVALNEEQARMFAEDPRVDVVTLYHGSTGDRLVETVLQQNPELARRGKEELIANLRTWQDMSPKTKVAKQLQKEYPGKFCCLGGKCSRDNNKCGFGLGAILSGVYLKEWLPNQEHEKID